MLKNLTIVILLVVAAVAQEAAAQKPDDRTADEKAIRANVEQMVKGWNAKSGVEFAKPFAEDADYIVINGMHLKGRAANAESHQRIFETIYKNSTLSYAVEQIRFPRPDIALVHVGAKLTVGLEASATTSDARITMVMIKAGGKWEIAAFQNTGVQNLNQARR